MGKVQSSSKSGGTGTLPRRRNTPDSPWHVQLNSVVDKIRQKCPSAVECEVLSRPKTILWAGSPVYEQRSAMAVASAAVTVAAVGVICSHAVSAPLPVALLGVCMLVGYDIYSGVLHTVLDHPGNIGLPILGQASLEFQWHHHIPDDIAVKGISQACADIMPALAYVTIVLWIISQFVALPKCLPLCICFKILWAFYGQFSHYAAHCWGPQRPRVAQKMQDAGLLVSPRTHRKHHTPPHDTCFCLVGLPFMDAFIQVMHEKLSPKGLLFIFVALSVDVVPISMAFDRLFSDDVL